MKQIAFYLPYKSLHELRIAQKKYWSLFVRTKFNISATSTVGIPDVCQHLLKYYGTTLVSLNVAGKKSIDATDLFDNIALLSNLSMLKVSVRIDDGQIWFKLTNLTNLYECNLVDYTSTSFVLQYWTNLTRIDFKEALSSEEDVKELVEKLTNLRDVTIRSRTFPKQFNDFFEWDIMAPVQKLDLDPFDTIRSVKNVKNFSRLKELYLGSLDSSIDHFPFSELLSLDKLCIQYGPHKPMVDLSKNTNLTWLHPKRGNPSFSNLVNLRQLDVETRSPATDNNFFIGLTNLEHLVGHVNAASIDPQWLESLNSTRLTFLNLFVEQPLDYRGLSKLTNLVDVTIHEQERFESCGRVNMEALTRLKRLSVQTVNITDFEDVSKATRLEELILEVPRGPDRKNAELSIDLSALTNLELLNLFNIYVPNVERGLRGMKKLTDLIVLLSDNSDYRFFETAPIKRFRNTNTVHSTDFWSVVVRCTTLESLTHRCVAPEDHISSLSALSHLTQLSITFGEGMDFGYLTVLTTLRVLELTSLDGVEIPKLELRQSLTRLENLYAQ